MREGRRALELTPPEKDSLDAADVVYYYAVMGAWAGERDLAIEQLARSAKMPAGENYAKIGSILTGTRSQIHASKKSSIPWHRSKTLPPLCG